MQLTALMYTVINNNSDLAKILIDYGADPNIQDFIGNTTIHHTIKENNNEILFKLISNSKTKTLINLNLHNIDNKLPIHLLLENESIDHNILKIFIDFKYNNRIVFFKSIER
jgi:ankyrin repeat protein